LDINSSQIAAFGQSIIKIAQETNIKQPQYILILNQPWKFIFLNNNTF
jgi:hypothetical protein